VKGAEHQDSITGSCRGACRGTRGRDIDATLHAARAARLENFGER
jgi:hypothetical protein